MEEHAPDEQYAETFEAMSRAGLSLSEVWVHYFSLGGYIDEYEVNAYLHGLLSLPELDRDMISQAVNELYDDICRSPRAPFSRDLHRRHAD
ncbi:hypothetical protein ACX80L_10040 [Arthrobacter sp. MDT1-48-3]